MATFGNSCVDRNTNAGINATVFDDAHPITEYGTIRSVCVYIDIATDSPNQTKVKVFRSNGSNYDFVAESGNQSVSVGSNTFSGLSIGVIPGDFIGIYSTVGTTAIEADAFVGSTQRQSGDITTNTAKTNWSNEARDISLLATYTPYSLDIYVDINKANDTGDGLSWANAKKTMNAGYTILNSTGTLHVATGDYSTQTTIIYNKSWSLSPEDPNSTGTKSVSIPIST